MLSQRESVRGVVILCCDTPGNVQKKEIIYACGYEGYDECDGYDKSEGPDDIRDLLCVQKSLLAIIRDVPDLSVYW